MAVIIQPSDSRQLVVSLQVGEGIADDVAVVPQQAVAGQLQEEQSQTVPEHQTPHSSPLPGSGASASNTPPSTLPSTRPTAPSLQTGNTLRIAEKILFFFMHELSEAASCWGQATVSPADPGQV